MTYFRQPGWGEVALGHSSAALGIAARAHFTNVSRNETVSASFRDRETLPEHVSRP
jgi:hypothetical protein